MLQKLNDCLLYCQMGIVQCLFNLSPVNIFRDVLVNRGLTNTTSEVQYYNDPTAYTFHALISDLSTVHACAIRLFV